MGHEQIQDGMHAAREPGVEDPALESTKLLTLNLFIDYCTLTKIEPNITKPAYHMHNHIPTYCYIYIYNIICTV